VLIWLLLRGCDKQKEADTLYRAAQDTLMQSRNKLGQQNTSIAILSTINKKQFTELKTNDSTIAKLQVVVRKYKGKLASATITSNVTRDKGSTSTTITISDTVFTEKQTLLYPTYESQWDDQWSKGLIRASKDSIIRDIKIRNEYEITQGEERQGLFRPKKLSVTIKNLNPNTETSELRTYTVSTPNKRYTIGLQGGYGIMLSGSGIATGPYVGIGIGFTIIKF